MQYGSVEAPKMQKTSFILATNIFCLKRRDGSKAGIPRYCKPGKGVGFGV